MEKSIKEKSKTEASFFIPKVGLIALGGLIGMSICSFKLSLLNKELFFLGSLISFTILFSAFGLYCLNRYLKDEDGHN